MKRVVICVVLLALGAVAGVSAAEESPMADAGLDQTVTVNTTVQLDATGSTHPGGPVTAYEWTIRTPDGREIQPDCADCERTQFVPASPGRYEATVEVSGPDGGTATDTLFVYVGDAGPSVELSGDTTPDSGEPVAFTAVAESTDTELEEVAWAVDDEIVAIQSLDGARDRSEVVFAFDSARTHRVQVVVRDTSGRTTYDHLFVRPRGSERASTRRPSGSSGSSSTGTSSVPDSGPDGVDSWEVPDINREPTPTPEPVAESTPTESPPPERKHIEYETDGYRQHPHAGASVKDSSLIGLEVKERGLDGGENAPWNQGGGEQVIASTAGEATRFLFGQERKTVTCEVVGGERGTCDSHIRELEREGQTTNVYSPDESGTYSEYGLEGGERTSGPDPRELEEGQEATVTVVIQQREEGAVDKTVDAVGKTKGSAEDRVRNVLGSGRSDSSTASASTADGQTRTPTGERTTTTSQESDLGGLTIGTSGTDSSKSRTSGEETARETSDRSGRGSGLVS